MHLGGDGADDPAHGAGADELLRALDLEAEGKGGGRERKKKKKERERVKTSELEKKIVAAEERSSRGERTKEVVRKETESACQLERKHTHTMPPPSCFRALRTGLPLYSLSLSLSLSLSPSPPSLTALSSLASAFFFSSLPLSSLPTVAAIIPARQGVQNLCPQERATGL